MFGWFIAVLVISSTVWVYFDMKAIKSGGVVGTIIGMLLLWIIVFPVHLFRRRRLQRDRREHPEEWTADDVDPKYERRAQVTLRIGGALSAVVLIITVVFAVTKSSSGPGGETLTAFNSDIQHKLTSPKPSGFAVSGVSSVSCVLPNGTAPGKTFTCFAYDSSQNEVGEVDGTFLATQSGFAWNANLQWEPSL